MLSQTTDQVQVVTDSAASIDIHATWVDVSGVNIIPGRQNTHVAAAATTIVVPSPGSGVQRNLKTLHVRNKDPSLSALVTIQFNDGSPLPIYAANRLLAGMMLEIVDMGGIKIAPLS